MNSDISQQREVVSCHSHTYLCGHAELVKRRAFHALANAQHMRGIAYCCHNPFVNNDVTPNFRMPFSMFDQYLQDYREEKAFAVTHFPELEILLAMEVDYCGKDPSKTLQFVNLAKNFDFLIGAIHFYDLAFPLPQCQVFRTLKQYCADFKRMVDTNWFQIVSHLDVIRLDIGSVHFYAYFEEDFWPYFKDLIDYLALHNQQNQSNLMAIEVNTGGAQYDVQFPYFPHPKIIKYANSMGIPIALSCDAHQSFEVGRLFPEVLRDLENWGVESLVYYEKRKMKSYKVADAIASFVQIVDPEGFVEQFKSQVDCEVTYDYDSVRLLGGRV